jgi:hypothetical protein
MSSWRRDFAFVLKELNKTMLHMLRIFAPDFQGQYFPEPGAGIRDFVIRR